MNQESWDYTICPPGINEEKFLPSIIKFSLGMNAKRIDQNFQLALKKGKELIFGSLYEENSTKESDN